VLGLVAHWRDEEKAIVHTRETILVEVVFRGRARKWCALPNVGGEPMTTTLAPKSFPAGRAEASPSVMVIADDAVAARRVMRALQSGGLDVVERGRCADVVVLACDVSRVENTSTLRRLRRDVRQGGIVVVARGSAHGNVRELLNVGADGFLTEDELEPALAAVVRAVAIGYVAVPRALRRCVARPAFSHREREVLALVVEGLHNREIADRLYLAESTIKSHVASSFAKLGVRSRKEAAAIVLDPDEDLRELVLGDVRDAPSTL
jgi:DNA-binding NarL/FixJ family response regulator